MRGGLRSRRRPRVVVIGAGMAGLTAARRLVSACDVLVLDKGRGVGGRMATRRIGDAVFDHGAQFVTAHTDEFAERIRGLADDGVVVPWFRGRIGPDGVHAGGGHDRYRGAVSMNAVARALAVGLDVRTGVQVAALGVEAHGWRVLLADGSEFGAEAVVATAPVPQSLALLEAGGVRLADGDADALGVIAYDRCLAVMAVLDGPSGLPAPGAVDPQDGSVDWVADNRVKGISAVPAVTIHAAAAYSGARWTADDAEIAAELLTAAKLESPPVAGLVQVQRWRYARPSVGHPHRTLVLDGLPPFAIAGDAFGGAKVEGAALSGTAAAEALVTAFGLGT
ncbi:MAG: NAD(P)/FAD-dependent oxidoreductase [Actinomycetota bacterium]